MPNSENTRQKGSAGEELAVDYLLTHGYTIVSRNSRNKIGEIDCIAMDPDGTLVFVEVKSARSLVCGHPLSWITPAKQRKIAFMARRYLALHQIHSARCRFDVISILRGKIEHIKNAFLI